MLIAGRIFAQLLFYGQKMIDAEHKFEYTLL